MVRVFASSSEDRGSIPGRVIPKTQKMVLDASLLIIVRIKEKAEQSRERRITLLYGVVANEKGAFMLPLTTVGNFTFFLLTLNQWQIRCNTLFFNRWHFWLLKIYHKQTLLNNLN